MAATDLIERSEVEVVPSLASLEETLRLEHDACLTTARKALDHALRAGDALLQIRALLMRTREWTPWLQGNDDLSRTQAYTYMRLAAYREHLPADIGIKDGEALLTGLPSLGSGKGRPSLPDPMKQDAQRMREEDPPVGYKEIAKRLGVSPSTVHNWFNGTNAKHQREAAAALREQKQQRAIRRAVSKAGGALAEAYAMAERMDDVLGQAHSEATDPEARRELTRAHEYQRAMRDAVVSALGVES